MATETGASWIDALLAKALNAISRVYYAGTDLVARAKVEYTGAGVSVADNPSTLRTVVTIPGVEGAFTADGPVSVGTANHRGNSADPARRNHVHAHGSHNDPDNHAPATGGEVGAAAGFMTPAHVDQLDDATAGVASLNDILDNSSIVARAVNNPAGIVPGYAPLAFVRTGTKWLDPRSTTPGADFETLQGTGYHCQTNGDAIYTWEKKTIGKGGLEFFCKNSRAIIRPGFTGTGGADADANHVISFASSWGSSLGTVQRPARGRTSNLRVNFNPSPYVGMEMMVVSGPGQSATAYYPYNANVTGYEKVRFKNYTGSGPYDVTLEKELEQNHDTGSTVHLVLDAVNDVTIAGVDLQFAGSAHAVGLLLSGVSRVNIEDVRASGFSRGQIHVLNGTTGSIGIKTALGTNSSIMIRSSFVEITDFTTDRTGGPDRKHSSGVPRGLITSRHNSRVTIRRARLEGGCTALSLWGGTWDLVDVKARDFDPKARGPNDSELVLLSGSRVCAGGLDCNGYASPSDWNEYGMGCTVRSLVLEDCASLDAGNLYPSAYVQNVHGFVAHNVRLVNTGASSYAQTAAPELASTLEGWVWYDAYDARMFDFASMGHNAPLRFEGNTNFVRVDNIHVTTVDGHSTSAVSLAKIGGDGAAGRVSLGHVVMSSNDGVLIGQGYAAPSIASMMRFSIDSLVFAGTKQRWDNIHFAYQTESVAVPQGSRMEVYADTLSAVNVRKSRNPSDTRTQNKAIAICAYGGNANGTTPQNTWGLVAGGPNLSVKSSGTPLPGETLKPGTGRDMVVDALDDSCGLVMNEAFAGFTQVLKYGAPSPATLLGRDNGASPAVSPGLAVECGQFGGTTGQTGYLSLLRSGAAFLRLYKVHASALAMIEAAAATYLYLSSPAKVWLGIDANGAGWPYVQADQADASVTLGGQISTPVKTHARTGTLTPVMNGSTASALNQAGNVEAGEELTGPITWANPTGGKAGLVKMTLMWRGDGTQTVAWGSNYRFGSSGSNQQPASTAADNMVYVCNFECLNGTIFRCTDSTVTPA